MGNGKREKWMEREMKQKEKEKRDAAKEEEIGREAQTETKTEGEKAPPLRFYSVLLTLACVKCKAAGWLTMLPAHIQPSPLLLSDRETEEERKTSSLDSTLSSLTMEGEKTEGEATSDYLHYRASQTLLKLHYQW